MKDDIILQVENLHTGFLVDNVPLEAVSGVSFSLKAGARAWRCRRERLR